MGRTDFPISGIPEISGNVASLHVNSKGKIKSPQQEAQWRVKQCCITQESKPNMLSTELFWLILARTIHFIFQVAQSAKASLQNFMTLHNFWHKMQRQ